MGLDTAIFYGVAKMVSATLLGDIFRLRQCTKNMLKYIHKNSRYGYLVTIPASDTRESARDKGRVEKILLHLSNKKE